MSNDEIIFLTGDINLLDEIKELWEGLKKIHIEKSVDFRSYYTALTFQERKESLVRHAENGKLFIVIACRNNLKIGYCASSVVDGIGEINSIFINSDFRKKNVGNKLMEISLDWIKSNDAKKIIVQVAADNEEVFGFYSKYGFTPRFTEMQIV